MNFPMFPSEDAVPSPPSTSDVVAAVGRHLQGSRLVGVELDTKFRVAAVTVELASPIGDVDPADPRVQVLLHPVGRTAASLRVDVEGRWAPRTFALEQLPDVAAAFDGEELHGPVFGREPGADWGAVRALDGRAQVADGHLHRAIFEAEVPGDRAFGFFATFDTVEIRDEAQRQLDPHGLRAV